MPITSADQVTPLISLLNNLKPSHGRWTQNAATSLANAVWTACGNWTQNSSNSTDVTMSGTSLTINTAGLYLIIGQVQFAVNSVNKRGAAIFINGVLANQTVVPPVGAASNDPAIPVMALQVLSAADVVTLRGFQDSGAALNTAPASTKLSIVRLGSF